MIEGASRTGLAILYTLCEAAAPMGPRGTGAEGQMPGEGSNGHWGKVSCGNSHCLEKVVGFQTQTLLMDPSK